MPKTSIVWFRQDLRLADNPALSAALAEGGSIVPLFILDDDGAGLWRLGGASRWWLHHSLSVLNQGLNELGAPLIFRRGPAAHVLDQVIKETAATSVYWNRCYEPFAVSRDKAIKSELSTRGLDVQSFNGALLNEPWNIQNKSGKPFRVFTPFWRAVTNSLEIRNPLPKPSRLKPYDKPLLSDDLNGWHLLPTKPDWAGGLRETWQPGEERARHRLFQFIDHKIGHYAQGRDIPSGAYTSYLSPHLHWGEISPQQIWASLDTADVHASDSAKFKSELGWREFSHHLLFHEPTIPEGNLRREFDAFPWVPDEALLRAWQRGKTGYPIVDAGMRELWHTGWMHNRVRMITASFLVKHLLQPWQDGARWFWDTLVDADLANNSASWQWVAGCGADAAPYFRIFNPVLQGEKFDPDGTYVRQWIPELETVPKKWVHKPWTSPEAPKDYPRPIVDLAEGRQRALAAYATLKAANVK